MIYTVCVYVDRGKNGIEQDRTCVDEYTNATSTLFTLITAGEPPGRSPADLQEESNA